MDKTKNAVNIFNKYAQEYQNKFMDVSLYADSLDFFCDLIKQKNASLLELACGPGNITKYLLQKRSDLQITGIDLAPKMIELAKINNPNAEFMIMDCRHISNLNKKQDAILCGFCLPYLSQQETTQLIGNASNLLKPNGVLYISTMEDDYTNSGYKKGSNGDEIYMHYYQETDLKTALEKNGFKTVKVDRITSTSTNGSEVIDLIVIAQKQ